MADLTAVGTITLKSRSVFGNKRWVVFDVIIGDGAGGTWPSSGLTINAKDVGLRAFDYCETNHGSLVYELTASTGALNAYTADTGGAATTLLIKATGSAPYETIRVMAIGYGVNNS
jgi:hypothetical protein